MRAACVRHWGAGLPELTVKFRSGAVDDMANAREGAQSARDSAEGGLKCMRGKLKIFPFLVEFFLER